MKKINKLLFCLAMLIGLVYVACRKSDTQIVPIGKAVSEKKFFSFRESNDPLVQAVSGYIKRQNDKIHFVDKTVKQIGYPYWDKAMIIKVPGGSYKGATDSTNIIYIPFVRDAENFVNASLIIRTEPMDTSFKYLCDWQYNSFGSGSNPNGWNARNVFHMFARLDGNVFGRKMFRIIDSSLMTAEETAYLNNLGLNFNQATVTYSLDTAQSPAGKGNLWLLTTVCSNIYTCIQQQLLAFRSNNVIVPGNCPSGYYLVTEQCTDIWEYIPSSGDGGGNGGGGTTGGGSGSGPGGGTPIECTGGLPNKNAISAPCTPGWEPGLTSAQIAIANQLNNILNPGDYFYFTNNIDLDDALVFTDVAAFHNYLSTNSPNHFPDLSIPPTIIDQTQKIEHGKFNLTFLAGVDISCKLSKTGSAWTLINVTSTDYGISLGWSWEQTDYSQSTNGTEITLQVEGYVRYNLLLDGIGTLYKEKYKFQLKINTLTGKITSLSEI